MKRLIKVIMGLPVWVICLILTSCGNAGNEDVAGDDWRTTGVVVDSGTITHDGESVDVLVTVDPKSAAFYWDNENQVLFDSVSFPMTIPDAKKAFNGIYFEDINEDEESDVVVDFIHADGGETYLVWIWDPEKRYVFREDLSFDSVSTETSTAVKESRTDTGNKEEGRGDIIASEVPYFEENGLEINANMDEGTLFLQDGVCTYSGLGDGYAVNDCYWEVTKKSDYTHGDVRVLEFDAICYIPDTSVPFYAEQYITNVTGELYDYYSGMWFTAATAYNSTGRDQNHYKHTIKWDGQDCEIEFFYSTNWNDKVGDWAQVLTKSYIVYMPSDYDGLVFTAQTQPDNYKDCAKVMQLDSIAPEGKIMEIDLLDPYHFLYFDVCH